jgi:hypothetical protein
MVAALRDDALLAWLAERLPSANRTSIRPGVVDNLLAKAGGDVDDSPAFSPALSDAAFRSGAVVGAAAILP